MCKLSPLEGWSDNFLVFKGKGANGKLFPRVSFYQILEHSGTMREHVSYFMFRVGDSGLCFFNLLSLGRIWEAL